MPRIVWTGDASTAERAQESLAKKTKEYNETLKGATLSAKALDLQAQRLVENADPQEKYNRKMRELKGHVDAGRISAEQFDKAIVKYSQDLERAGRSGDQAFGAKFVSQMGLAVGAIGGVAGALAIAKTAFGDVEQSAQAAADRTLNALGAVGELGQLGDDAPRALRIARNLVGRDVTKNMSQAANIASDMLNSGLNDQEIQFVVEGLAASKRVKPEGLATIAGDLAKTKRAFNEESLESVTGRMLEAAGRTGADFAQTVNETLKFSTMAVASGASLDEAAASFVISENNSASPAAASEYMKAFFSQVYKRDLAQGDLQGTLDSIKEKVGNRNPFSVLGSTNAVVGYELLQGNRPELDRLEGVIGRAKFVGGNPVFDDPVVGAANVRSLEEGALQEIQDRHSDKENLYDAVRAARRRRNERLGIGPLRRWAQEAADATDDMFGQEEFAFRSALRREEQEPGFLLPETKGEIERYFERMAKAAEETAANTRQISGKQTSRAVTVPE